MHSQFASLFFSVACGFSLGFSSGIVPLVFSSLLAKDYVIRELAVKKIAFVCCTYTGMLSSFVFGLLNMRPDCPHGMEILNTVARTTWCAALVSPPILSTVLPCGFYISISESAFCWISANLTLALILPNRLEPPVIVADHN